MKSSRELILDAVRLGLRLESRGDKLAVIPASRCPPEFAAILRARKEELLSWLKARVDGLSVDRAPWLHIAKQVLAGEFHDADKSTVESLTIGLRSIQHPVCERALERLRPKRNT